MGKKSTIALLLVAGLALTACSGQPQSEQPPASESATGSNVASETPTDEPTTKPSPANGEAEYAFATGMTFGKVTTSGSPGKELDAFLDAAGKKVGEDIGDQFTFWTVKIDNREGTEEAFPNEFRVYDEAGEEYLFARGLDIVDAVNEELPELSDDVEYDSPEARSYDRLFDLYQKAFDAEDYSANPGAVKTFTIVTGDKLPEKIKRMTIDLGGLTGEADVITMSDAEAQGYPLDF